MKTKTEGAGFSVTSVVFVPEQTVADVLNCGFEGGIGYWCEAERYDAELTNDIAAGRRSVRVREEEGGDDGEPGEWKTLDRAAVVKGLELFASLYPERFAREFIGEQADAETGDILIQLSVLGEVVYA